MISFPLLLTLAASAAAGAERADWVAGDGERVAFGSGRRVVVALSGSESAPVLQLQLDAPVSGAAFAGGRLFLVEDGETLTVLDPDAAQTRRVSLDPPAAGRLHVAGLADYLLAAEDGRGLRVLEAGSRASRGGARAVHVGLLPFRDPVTALAASGRSAFVALSGRGIFEVALDSIEDPGPLRFLSPVTGVRSLASGGSTLDVLVPGGLQVLDLAHDTAESHPGIRGSAIHRVGRTLHIAAGELGLVTRRDGSFQQRTHSVSVGNNFFSPVGLSIDAGDTVQWTNVTGVDHNVFSCISTQLGCNGSTSNETFTSGTPSGFWAYGHTFVAVGSNPYVCQPHAPGMVGTVTVVASGPPPGVPDGTSGAPMTVGKLAPDGSSLSVAWDTTSCVAVDYEILFGSGAGFPDSGGVYDLEGSRCHIGSVSPFIWSDSPSPATDPTGLIWWIVVATDGSEIEGSWGVDGANRERRGPGAQGSSAECGIVRKNLTNPCGQ